MPGETISYTITVANGGPGVSKAPTISDQVPAGVLNAVYSVNGGAAQQMPSSGSIALADIPAGGAVNVVISGTVAKALGSLSNTATVTRTTPGTHGQATPIQAATPNNPSIAETADLTVTKRADKAQYLPGEPIYYTITVANNGPGASRAPVITDQVPAGVMNAHYSVNGGAAQPLPATGNIALEDIPFGGVVNVVVSGIVAKALGSLSNTATVTSTTPGTHGQITPIQATAPNAPTITETADMTFTKLSDKIAICPARR